MDNKRLKKILILVFLLSFLSSFITLPSNGVSKDKSTLEYVSLRIVRQGRLNFLLSFFAPEKIAGIESPRKFVIHSASSGTGQGAIKELLLKLYPDRFEKFLLYATRSRRGIDFNPADPRYPAVKKYLDTVSAGKSAPSFDGLIEKYNLQHLSQRELEELKSVLEPNWTQILAGAPRTEIPGLEERFEETQQGSIKAYTEFNGVHYWFVSEEEIFRLRDEKGIIVEPVREYYQGLDIEAIAETFKAGNNKIYILEGDRIWFEYVKSRFPEATSIFIAPISDNEFKDRMIEQFGEAYRDEVMSLNISDLLKGGIEKYIREKQPQLIEFPVGLTPIENTAFLNIRNSILAAVGYKIVHSETDVRKWLDYTRLVKDVDLQAVAQRTGSAFTVDNVVEIANSVYEEISGNAFVLNAMKVIIAEMVGRLEYRLRLQNQNPNDPKNIGNTYVRASQSPREYGGSVDYGDILVNTWGQLDTSVQDLVKLILEKLYESIPH